MFTTVVVPLDGSPLSETVLPHTRALAARLERPIELVTSSWGGADADSDAYLDRVAATLDWPGTTTVVADRFAAAAIADVVEAAGDPIVCMATHGRTGLGRALLGSTAEEVIRSIDRPVVLVGPAVGDAPESGPTDLVVTLDGSPTAASALPVAIELARSLDVDLVLLTVEDPGAASLAAIQPMMGDDFTPAELATTVQLLHDAEQRDPHGLDPIVADLRASGLGARAERLEGKDPARAIADFAASRPAPLLCMATHGRGGIERAALGSVAMRVVHQATCPVLVVRPPADVEAGS